MIASRVACLLEAPFVVGTRVFETRDAIVVLGAALDSRGRPRAALAERIAAAIELWRAGGGRVIVATGGATGRAPCSEADAIAGALRAAGVPSTAIVIEPRARSTADNARFTAALVTAHRLWIVTQPFHGRRAARAFRRAGFDARVWHVDAPPRLAAIAREYAAWLRALVAR